MFVAHKRLHDDEIEEQKNESCLMLFSSVLNSSPLSLFYGFQVIRTGNAVFSDVDCGSAKHGVCESK
jgi:hypothetical protein